MPTSYPSGKVASPSKQYRHDINGLRAWAVLAVMFYHFDVPGFAGGFVGVDMFFVISGFLMTAIIINGLEQNRFSLWEFYLARARRILPALMMLLACLVIPGWFWLPTADYHTLAAHAAAALLFISNLIFWRQTSYFEADAHETWLLHTWSLSVEWQFYILLPIGCIVLWRWWGYRGAQVCLLAIGLASLLVSIYASSRWPGAAFYLLPARIWEMLAGGMIWWLTRTRPMIRPWARLAEGLGFILIILAIVMFDATLRWPGYLALVPVAGTMLVLAAHRSHSWLTANPLTRHLGASSYSVYLWHWPLVVLLTYSGQQDNPLWIAAGIVFSLLLGELSLRWIEIPTRRELGKLTFNRQQCVLGSALLLTGLMAVGARFLHVDERIDPAIERIARESENVNPRQDACFTLSGIASTSCVFGGETIKAIVIGDSHADAMITSVQQALKHPNEGVLDWSYVSCPTIDDLHRNPDNKDADCYGFNKWAAQEIVKYDRHIPLIIINRTSAYAFGEHNIKDKMHIPLAYFDQPQRTITPDFIKHYSAQLVKTACTYAQARTVYITRPVPEMMYNVPKTLSRAMMFGQPVPQIFISLEAYHQRNAAVWAAQDQAARQCGVKILDPLPYLCHDGRCSGSKAGLPIYRDDDHLSEYGNKLLVPMFRTVFQ